MAELDPSIYSGMMRPVPQVNPVDMATKAADLKLAIARSQMAPIELQRQQEEAGALHQRNQAAAEDVADQKTIQQIYGDVQNDSSVPPDKKHDELMARLAGKVKPAAATAVNKQIEEHDTAVRKASDDNLTQALKVNTEINNQLATIDAVPDPQKPAAYAGVVQNIYRLGLAKPGEIPATYDPTTVAVHKAAAMGAVNSATAEISRREQANKDAEEKRKARADETATAAQQIDGIQDQDSYTKWRAGKSPEYQALTAATYSPQNVAQIKRMGLTASQQREADEAKGSKTVTTDQGVMQFNPDTGRYDIGVGGAPTKAGPNPTEVTLAQQVARGKQKGATPEEVQSGIEAEAALKRLDQSKIASRGVTNIVAPAPKDASGRSLTGDEFLATLPAGRAAQVKAYAEGRQTSLPRGKEQQPFLDMVNQYDPGFTTQRAQVRKAFTTGPDGKNIGNLNTAIVHLGTLMEIAEAMDNGTFQPGNALYNAASTMLGSPAPTNYETLRQAVAGEQDQALHGTSTVEGRKAILATIPSKAAPGQMTGVVKTGLQTMATKAHTYDERYHAQLPDDNWSPILPSAKAVLGRHGIGQDGHPAPATHRIKVGSKLYDYNGTGATDDLKNYTEVRQ